MPDKKIYETIKHFENDLKRTESKFSTDARNFEREFVANRPVAYSFDGSNNLDKQLAYNLSAVEKMGQLNRRFHADCEAMIITIDSTCRPLLPQKPSAQAVGALVDLIQKICTTISETVTAFTVSFDGHNIGEIGSMQPEASVVVRAILKFWENYYESMPGYKENCLRIAQEKRDKEQAKRNAERAKQEEKQRKVLAKKEKEATWKSVKEHRDHVAAEGESLILSFTKSVQNEKEKHRASIIQSAKIALEQDQADANQQLSQLGFFALQAKSDLKKKIAAIQKDLLHIDQCHYARKKLDELDRKASAAIEAYRKEIELYLSKRFECTVTQEYNCPIEADAGDTKLQRELENIKRTILIELNSCDEPIDLATLVEFNSELCAYTNQKLSALMMQLLQSGHIVRSERNGKAHYAIARKLSVTTTEQWTENKKMAEKALPVPPSIESVFLL